MIDKLEIKNHLKIIRTIYFALIIGLLLFFIVALYFIRNRDIELGSELDNIFVIIVPAFGLFMMFFSRVIYKKKIANYNIENGLHKKITDFRTFRIILWAMIESACFLSLVALMATANYLYAVVFIFLMGYFLFMRPTKESLIVDMRLKTNESDLILKS
jgi:hypothetical protein